MGFLDWSIEKLRYFSQRRHLRDYEKHVHGGPAPVSWRVREGIPAHNRWSSSPRKDRAFCSDIIVGAVKCGPVKPVPAKAFPTGANRDFKKYPSIICLCGAPCFIEQFAIQTWELERKGNIVLGYAVLAAWYCNVSDRFGEASGTKEQWEELHRRKIDLADEVLVLNVGGYIGDLTRDEIEYAKQQGKPVKYLENEA